MDIIVGTAVKLVAKWAIGQFTCPQCRRFAGTTMHFGCCGNHVCVPCFENLKSVWRGQETARCPFCRGACGMVCVMCEKYLTSGKRCTTKCCHKSTCEKCMDRYCHQAVAVAQRTGVLTCPLCDSVVPDRVG